MTDIVERLREANSDYHNPLMREAADEIERLRAYQDEAAKAWTKLTDSQDDEIEQLCREIKRLQAALIEAAEMVNE